MDGQLVRRKQKSRVARGGAFHVKARGLRSAIVTSFRLMHATSTSGFVVSGKVFFH